MGSIRVDGFDPATSNYNVTIPPFTVGTTDTVPITFFADCCVRRAALTVFDVAGNVNSTSFNQGPLKGYFCTNLLKSGSLSNRRFGYKMTLVICGNSILAINYS